MADYPFLQGEDEESFAGRMLSRAKQKLSEGARHIGYNLAVENPRTVRETAERVFPPFKAVTMLGEALRTPKPRKEQDEVTQAPWYGKASDPGVRVTADLLTPDAAGILPAMKLGKLGTKALSRLTAQEGRPGDVRSVMLDLQERNLPHDVMEKAAKHEMSSPAFAEARPYLSPDELAKAARSNVTPQKYEENMALFPSSEEMMAVARAGEPKRGWYRGSREAEREVYTPQESTRMAYGKSSLSPQTSVESNLENTLSVNREWEAAGRPLDAASINKVLAAGVQQQPLDLKPRAALQSLAKKFGIDPDMPTKDLMRALERIDPEKIRAASVLPAWEPNYNRAMRGETLLSGPKVDSFGGNLDPNNPFAPLHVTNDTWIARYSGVPQTTFSGSLDKGGKFRDPGYSPAYSAVSARQRQAADQLGWSPEEVQETIWSWAKPMGEGGGKYGLLVPSDKINAVPDFRTLLTQERYMKHMTPEQRARAERMGAAMDAPPSQFRPNAAERAHLERAKQRVMASYLRDKAKGDID